MSFLDAFFGYNQIPLYEPDGFHTSFVTDRGLYYYEVMPIGLKNIGATYQKLMNRILQVQTGVTAEV